MLSQSLHWWIFNQLRPSAFTYLRCEPTLFRFDGVLGISVRIPFTTDRWCHQISRLTRIPQAQFAGAFTSLAAFSMSRATAFGCDT